MKDIGSSPFPPEGRVSMNYAKVIGIIIGNEAVPCPEVRCVALRCLAGLVVFFGRHGRRSNRPHVRVVVVHQRLRPKTGFLGWGKDTKRRHRAPNKDSHLPLSTGGGGDVDESPDVLDSLLRTSLGSLGLCYGGSREIERSSPSEVPSCRFDGD